MVYLPTTAITVVTGAGLAIKTELETQGRPVARYCPAVPGDIAWDSCDCEGQLAQSITAVTPSNDYPTAATAQRTTACGPRMNVLAVTTSLVRCVHSLTTDSQPPSCDVLLADAVGVEVDRWVVRTELMCYLRGLYSVHPQVILDFTVGAVTTVGPQGGCGGVECQWQFAVGTTCCG